MKSTTHPDVQSTYINHRFFFSCYRQRPVHHPSSFAVHNHLDEEDEKKPDGRRNCDLNSDQQSPKPVPSRL